MQTYRAGAGRVRPRRGRAALGRRGQASTSTSSPGISVCSVGHCHPAVVEAIARAGRRRSMHISNLFYTEPMVRLAERLCESSLGGRRLLLQLGHRGERVRDQARPQARPRPRHRRARDRRPRGRLPRPHATARSRRRRGSRPTTALGPMLPGFRSVPLDDADALARGGRRADGRGPDRADPGRDRRLPDLRRDCSSPRARPATRPARCWSSTRSRPGWGGPARSGPTSRLPVRPDVMTTRQGARRRAAGRCLRHDARGGGRCSSPATTARPSPAARCRRGRRSPCSTWSTTPSCCAGCGSWGAGSAMDSAGSTASPRSAAAA